MHFNSLDTLVKDPASPIQRGRRCTEAALAPLPMDLGLPLRLLGFPLPGAFQWPAPALPPPEAQPLGAIFPRPAISNGLCDVYSVVPRLNPANDEFATALFVALAAVQQQQRIAAADQRIAAAASDSSSSRSEEETAAFGEEFEDYHWFDERSLDETPRN